MKKRHFLFILIFSIAITYLFFIFHPFKAYIHDFSFRVGQIADRDIIAPFTFDVLKNEAELEQERNRIRNDIDKIYRISEQRKFNTLKNLDFLIQKIAALDGSSIEKIKNELTHFGYSLSEEVIIALTDPMKRLSLHSYLTDNISRIMDIGIYPDNYEHPTITVNRNSELLNYQLRRLFSLQEAKNRLVSDVTDPDLIESVEEITKIILIDNLVLDNDKMNEIVNDLFNETVSPILTTVLENEEIVRKNRKITELDIRKLNALSDIQKQMSTEPDFSVLFLSMLGIFLYSILLLTVLYFILIQIFNVYFKSSTHWLIIFSAIFFIVVCTVFLNNIISQNSLLIPLSFATISIAILFNPLISLIVTIFSYLFTVKFLNWEIINPLIMLISNLIILIFISKISDKHRNFQMFIYLLLSYTVTNLLMSFITFTSWDVLIFRQINIIAVCFLSVAGVILLLPIIEKKLNLATKLILLELLDTNNPILKKMALEIPGTYHHSQTVGFLVESVAEVIGANPLLARVGSYYHDIGKLENPQLFIENNSESTFLHEKMSYEESAEFIKQHVSAGVSLAQKYKLPRQVIEIIKQHHGDSAVAYFLKKAEKEKQVVDKKKFSYPGPKPQTKEAALVMIADIIESTTKAKVDGDINESALKNIIDDTIAKVAEDGQLDESPITFKDIAIMKNAMLSILSGIYRKRIEYPESDGTGYQ